MLLMVFYCIGSNSQQCTQRYCEDDDKNDAAIIATLLNQFKDPTTLYQVSKMSFVLRSQGVLISPIRTHVSGIKTNTFISRRNFST